MPGLSRENLKSYLKPIIRAFVRHGLSIHDLINLAKELFVDVAQEEMAREGRKPNVSRISVMTGLYRREVSELLKGDKRPTEHGASLLARIVAKWQTDPKFLDAAKRPRPLTWKSNGKEFSALVYSVSTDTHDGTILNELVRAEIASLDGDTVHLRKREALVPGDIVRAMGIIETNLEGCIRSAEENVLGTPEIRNVHLRTAYDNISADKLPEIKRWLLQAGSEFHQKLRGYLASFDKDSTVSVDSTTEGGAKIIVSSFSFAELPKRQPTRKTTSRRGKTRP